MLLKIIFDHLTMKVHKKTYLKWLVGSIVTIVVPFCTDFLGIINVKFITDIYDNIVDSIPYDILVSLWFRIIVATLIIITFILLVYRPKLYLCRHTSLSPNIGDVDEYYKEHYWIKTIELDQTNNFSESYPDRASIKHLDEVALQLSNNTQKSRCGYYGIAHTPMIFRFGFKMGDSGRNVMLFHKLRHGEVNFNELSDVPDGKGVYVFEKNKSIKSDELIVSIATSAQINEQNLVDLNPKNKHIVMFDALNYDVDYITSKVTIQYIKDSILTYVRMRVKEYGIQKLHIVIASSVAFTFALGQSFSNQMDPQIVVYHYVNGTYYWGICVNKDYNDPKCIEFTSACDS